MSDALRKALGGLRGDALRATRKGGDDAELLIRIGLANEEPEEEAEATFPNELVEPRPRVTMPEVDKQIRDKGYPEETTRRRR